MQTCRILTCFLIFISLACYSQEKATDSVKVTQMEEVVVTGQYEPQSLKKSVYNVRVISRQDIERQAGNNLADVLNQYLNITVRPSGNDGRSTVSMFGLDGQYFKILVDNIPLVGDTGLGNNIDLTQINLDDIERIEIIEGSMGVTHGANAVTGILNIITKKNGKHKWEVTATAQEETVGSEFALFNKGRHIQALKVSHTISERWFASIGANRNDFAGYFNNRKGKDYIDTSNDYLRGYSWLPKEQFVANALIGYNKGKFRVFYKFDYYHENVDFFNPVVIPVDNYPFSFTYYSTDRRYITNRYYHHLNSYGHLFSGLTYNVSLSHQKQSRDQEDFNYYIITQEEKNNIRQTFQSKEILYSTGNVTNFFTNKKYDLQLGYEAVNENGFASANSGTFRNEAQGAQDIRRRLENYDVYASAEVNFTEKFSMRPGFRHSFQSKFKDQEALSLGFRYLFNQGLETRVAVGKSYRTPNFDELYTFFVDSNHNLQGNGSLVPEQSMSYELSLKKTSYFDSGLNISNNFSASYLNVDDRISLVLAATTPIMQYRYLNIDQYKVWNIATTHQVAYKNFEARLGLSLVGTSQKIDTGALNAVSDDKFLYSLQGNANVAYNVPQWNTLFSIYYKYNGRYRQFTESTDVNNNVTFALSEVEAYSMMDASVRKSFLNKKLDVTLGARNLLNIKNIQATQGGATGTHAAGPSNLLLAYGRSYFLKLTYNLNFN
jgi:outer membrane receptor for ferrienterochelin and colicins